MGEVAVATLIFLVVVAIAAGLVAGILIVIQRDGIKKGPRR
jgi:hypothetical protein